MRRSECPVLTLSVLCFLMAAVNPAYAFIPVSETKTTQFTFDVPTNSTTTGNLYLPLFSNSYASLNSAQVTLTFQPTLSGQFTSFGQVPAGTLIAGVNTTYNFNMSAINAPPLTVALNYPLTCNAAVSGPICYPFSVYQVLGKGALSPVTLNTSSQNVGNVGFQVPITATSTVVDGSGTFSGDLDIDGTASVTYNYQAPSPLQKATAGAQAALLGLLIAACPECAPELLSIAEGMYGNLLQIVADPVDPNYIILATPSAPPDLTPPDIAGLTQQQTEAWDDLTHNLALWSTFTEPMLESINRAEGAYEAGNVLWEDKQLTNFDSYYGQGLNYAAAIRTDADALGLVSIPEP